MKWGALVLASILVSIVGMGLVAPSGAMATEDAMSCPAFLCIVHGSGNKPPDVGQVWHQNSHNCWITADPYTQEWEDQCDDCCNACEGETPEPFEVKGPAACWCVTIGSWDYCPGSGK